MPQLFAVERYDDTGGPYAFDPFPVLPDAARLSCTVYLPSDDVVLALVEGADEQSVAGAVGSVGWRVDRITTATWVTPPVTAAYYNRLVPVRRALAPVAEYRTGTR